MKKSKLKGFTLVELIVVMAIMSIFMVAVAMMWQPIRDVYVDSTLYETRRTAQNGVSQYINESVRYATDLGIYSPGKSSVIEGHTDSVSSVSTALKAFTRAYLFENGIYENDYTDPVTGYISRKDPDYTAKFNNTEKEIIKKAEIIVIDNSAATYNGTTCYGRVLRRKPNTSATSISEPSLASLSSDWRLAMGAAYYGENTFSIALSVPITRTTVTGAGGTNVATTRADGMLDVTVSSTNNGKRDVSKKAKRDLENTAINTASDLSALTLVTTNGGVNCRNITPTVGGMYDISKFDGAAGTYVVDPVNNGTGGKPKIERTVFKGNTATKTKKTYIIYINDEIKITK